LGNIAALLATAALSFCAHRGGSLAFHSAFVKAHRDRLASLA
jgi:hypothetical protein